MITCSAAWRRPTLRMRSTELSGSSGQTPSTSSTRTWPLRSLNTSIHQQCQSVVLPGHFWQGGVSNLLFPLPLLQVKWQVGNLEMRIWGPNILFADTSSSLITASLYGHRYRKNALYIYCVVVKPCVVLWPGSNQNWRGDHYPVHHLPVRKLQAEEGDSRMLVLSMHLRKMRGETFFEYKQVCKLKWSVAGGW